jgi:hypothetical protein
MMSRNGLHCLRGRCWTNWPSALKSARPGKPSRRYKLCWSRTSPPRRSPVLKQALDLQVVPWDLWEELHGLARKALEQAMFLHPEDRDKYTASLKALDKRAEQRKLLEQGELMKAA